MFKTSFFSPQVNLFVDEHSEVTAIICVCRRGSKGMKMMKDFECEQGGSLWRTDRLKTDWTEWVHPSSPELTWPHLQQVVSGRGWVRQVGGVRKLRSWIGGCAWSTVFRDLFLDFGRGGVFLFLFFFCPCHKRSQKIFHDALGCSVLREDLASPLTFLTLVEF